MKKTINTVLGNDCTETKKAVPVRRQDKRSKLLFRLSLSAPVVALGIVLLIWIFNSLFIGNLWVFYLFIPVPVASIIRGIFIKKKGKPYLKNFVGGIVVLSLLIIVGTLSVFLEDRYTKSDKHVKIAEGIIGMDIPKYTRCVTHRIDKGISNGHVLYICNAEFDNKDISPLENEIKSNDKWMKEIPTSLLGVSSPVFYLEKTDYTIIYNSTLDEINELPDESGRYNFICIMYDSAKNEMEIVEYTLDFVK